LLFLAYVKVEGRQNPLKPIILTSHAQDRLKERSVTKQQIIEVIKYPDITCPTRHRRRKRLIKTLNNKVIDVIIEEREKCIYVVTCAILKKEA
jgi:hypothetical protein